MAPKGTKKKAAAAAAPAEPAAAAAAGFSLRASDTGRGYLPDLENALATINGHPLFHNMVGEEPHTGSAAETCFTVLDNESYQRGIASGSCTAGWELALAGLVLAIHKGAVAPARGEVSVQHRVC